MKTIMRSVLVWVAVVLAGCATTTAELTSRTDNMMTWVVAAPLEDVFKAYKGHADQYFNGTTGLLGDGYHTAGYFYGDNAELTIHTIGNPLANITWLHFDLRQQGGATAVTAWYYNEPWKRNIERFQGLFPDQ